MQSLTYPDYGVKERVAVDIESKDPFLIEKGPGVYRKDGYVVGVSLSNGDISEYYPLRHPDTPGELREKNLKYLKHQLGKDNNKVFANCLYDLDWLVNYEDISVGGNYDDVQIAEPLIDEYRRSYSLRSLADTYLGENKADEEMKEYCIQQGWLLRNEKGVLKHLYKMPQDLVAKYGSEDARLTHTIFSKQLSLLKEMDLMQVYDIESRLVPLLLQMRKIGVRIDENKLTKTGIHLSDIQFDLQNELDKLAGFSVNCNSSKDLEALFKRQGLPIIYGEPTENMLMKGITKGNPRFDKNTLNRLDSDIAKKILELRHIKTLLNMFIIPYPELIVNGKLHCLFHALRSDNYGTVSGRFSSSNPNLQQVSAKKEEEEINYESEILTGQVIRKLFIPEEGCLWLKGDWSQIEYRLMAHYAVGDGSEEIRNRYNEDPDVDYHQELCEMTGIDNRRVIKTLNFGAAYGMGIQTMSKNYSWNLEEAKEVYSMYHSKVPFVKETGNRVAMKAKRVGFIKTLLKRRAHMPSSNKGYVMFNRLIQGGAADIMKKAMVDAYEAGVFNTLCPHITVHDEMNSSMPDTKEGYEAGKELKYIMENCIKLKVPIKADFEVGPNWGEVKPWEV